SRAGSPMTFRPNQAPRPLLTPISSMKLLLLHRGNPPSTVVAKTKMAGTTLFPSYGRRTPRFQKSASGGPVRRMTSLPAARRHSSENPGLDLVGLATTAQRSITDLFKPGAFDRILCVPSAFTTGGCLFGGRQQAVDELSPQPLLLQGKPLERDFKPVL